jgi:hypothetical protein
MSAESFTLPWHRSSVWVAFLFAVAGAVILGANWDKLVAENGERRLTKANYAKIKPEMAIEEVKNLLGPGRLIQETRKIVTANGKFTEHSWDDRNHRQHSGKVLKHDGKPSEETGKEMEWHEGNSLIHLQK